MDRCRAGIAARYRTGALLIPLLLAWASFSSASSAGRESLHGWGVLEGQIQCDTGRNPRVRLFPERSIAQVDSEGFFRFESLPAGHHTLLVQGNYCDAVLLSIDVRDGAAEWVDVELRCSKIPCTNPDRADPDCILKDPYDAARAGTRCQVHARPLRLGVVPIQYGIVGCTVGANGDASQFPNARVCYSGGCVVGPHRWAEVAYCDKCRAAYYWANPMQLLWNR